MREIEDEIEQSARTSTFIEQESFLLIIKYVKQDKMSVNITFELIKNYLLTFKSMQMKLNNFSVCF